MRKKITLLFVLLLLVGCSGKLTEGEVYEKEFEESYSVVRMIPFVTTNGKTTTTTIIPYVYRYPDRWVVRIKDFDKTKDKWIYNEFYVKEDVFNEIEIGDIFKYDPKRDYKEEPYEKFRK